MKAQHIMTRNPECCTPGDTAERAAQLMALTDCGCIPVVEDQQSRRLVGMITDRDLAVRVLATGKSASTSVREVMTANPQCCSATADVKQVERVMTGSQVRRVPIVDAEGRCIGIVSQADLARAARDGRPITDREVAIVVERISEPARVSARQGPAIGREATAR